MESVDAAPFDDLPYLTGDLPPVGGSMKASWDDFAVEEVPLFEPCGEGEHLYVSITKRGLTTPQAIERLARALRIPPARFGHAGLKDRHAVATQLLSIHTSADPDLGALSSPQLAINWARRHRHKLRAGQLRGNRFTIVVRELARPDRDIVAAVFAAIEDRGFPNYFGAQRFGVRRDGHIVGRAILRRRNEDVFRAMLGNPDRACGESEAQARAAFEAGRLGEARELFGPAFRLERELLRYFERAGLNYDRAVKRIPRGTLRLLLSAYQGYLFNEVLRERMAAGAMDALWQGDIAMKHENGACFEVEDVAAETARLRGFAISPTGPVFGTTMLRASGRQGEIEARLLAGEGMTADDFRKVVPGLELRGARRALRERPAGLSWELAGRDLRLSFTLAPGTYATSFLRELIKGQSPPAGPFPQKCAAGP